ncbi:MAG TPA: LptF/LptG family permease [Pelagibacteraceae bacterium]|nr:LptF/LptG family permease [Pelagibacteraceae bacterium]|tara:strand:+ start:224 stop:1351 length:1128 start_codon:yes stop_codon:yes gene_type:complete
MKNRIYKYFFREFIHHFLIVIFALTAIIWTIQAVNFLDLVTDDGHAFKIYLLYSFLTIPKVLTKLIPFTFLIASILTILKFEKNNELILLWTSGLNKIHITNLIFCTSLLIMLLQLLMGSTINPETLNFSRTLLKNSELQFVPSLLKEKQFNDAVKGLTIFVEKKIDNKTYKNILIRDDGNVLTQISSGSSTIFAKSGYVTEDEKNLVLLNGNIQKLENEKDDIELIKFEKTSIYLAGLSTRTISEPKIQETSSIVIIQCLIDKYKDIDNCGRQAKNIRDTKAEINRRFGMPIFIPLIALISCFLLRSKKDGRISGLYKYIYFFIGFTIIVGSEITVRYSGISLNVTLLYYLIPITLSPIVYLLLIRTFKYENLS